MTACINLKERFGRRFKITRDESYRAEHGQCGRATDPWTMIIPCQYGHIYPHGEDLLAASTDRRGGIARALLNLDCTTVLQDGDGVNVAFHIDNFAEVAQLMKPLKARPRMSAEHKAKLLAASEPYRFGRSPGSRSSETTPERTQEVWAV